MNDSADRATAQATPPDQLVACWSCKGPVAARALFCHTCGAVQPPRGIDHFTRLGLPVSFDVEMAALEKQYFGYQRVLHPDRFATKSAKERAISQSQAAALNEAYEVLRQPLARGAYLLELKGAPLADEGHTIDDPELLMEAMEAREALGEAATPDAVEALAARARASFEAGLSALSAQLAADDLPGARKTVLRLRYLDKFADEARQRRRKLTGGAA